MLGVPDLPGRCAAALGGCCCCGGLLSALPSRPCLLFGLAVASACRCSPCGVFAWVVFFSWCWLLFLAPLPRLGLWILAVLLGFTVRVNLLIQFQLVYAIYVGPFLGEEIDFFLVYFSFSKFIPLSEVCPNRIVLNLNLNSPLMMMLPRAATVFMQLDLTAEG